MAEKQLNNEHSFFYRADFLGVGKFIVGLTNTYPRYELEDRVWSTVRDYSKQHQELEIPDPYETLDFARSVNMLDFNTFRQVRITSAMWEVISGNCILAESIRTPSHDLVEISLPDMRLERPHQGPLF